MAKKEKETKNNKQKRHFFKDMKAELKKVIWPTPKQTANNTLAVIAFTVAIAIIVFVLDLAFDFGNKKGVVALQEKIKSSYSASANNTTDEGNAEDAESEEDIEDEEATTEESDSATNVEVETSTENSDNTDSE